MADVIGSVQACGGVRVAGTPAPPARTRRPEADAAHRIDAQIGVPLPQPDRADRDAVLDSDHAAEPTPLTARDLTMITFGIRLACVVHGRPFPW